MTYRFANIDFELILIIWTSFDLKKHFILIKMHKHACYRTSLIYGNFMDLDIMLYQDIWENMEFMPWK